MNAQEAIQYEEFQLEELKDKLAEHKIRMSRTEDDAYLKSRTYHKGQVRRLEQMLEQKSILLASAKYLHEEILEPSQQEEWRGKSGKRLSVLYDIPEERIEIMADDLEKIGIKEDKK